MLLFAEDASPVGAVDAKPTAKAVGRRQTKASASWRAVRVEGRVLNVEGI